MKLLGVQKWCQFYCAIFWATLYYDGNVRLKFLALASYPMALALQPEALALVLPTQGLGLDLELKTQALLRHM